MQLQQSFAIVYAAFFVGQSTFAAVPQYHLARSQLMRERASGTYDTFSWFMSKILVETPLFLIISWTFGPIIT